jgi:hypothetical protein
MRLTSRCGDLERRSGAALRELLHQRRPLLADADVEVQHLDAAGDTGGTGASPAGEWESARASLK